MAYIAIGILAFYLNFIHVKLLPMQFNALKYLTILIVPLIGVLALTQYGWLTWAVVIYAFAIVPLLEFLLPISTTNMSKAEEMIAKEDRIYDYLLYAIVPVQYGLVALFVYNIADPALSTFDIAGRVLSLGVACAVFGINVAHELGHRQKPFEQFLSKSLLLTSLYMHFFIEHNQGHHKRVATHEDPATSRYGEILYFFWVRSVIGGYLSAWQIEHARLSREGKAIFSAANQMIQYQVIQFVFVAAIAIFFGTWTAACFVVAAIIGFLLLETVNYIEHYGLQRAKNSKGIYERVLHVHSWNSNHILGRLMLFELSRHSDHHFRAARPYQILRHYEDSPQMPAGYPAMMVLSLFPPLWFYVMHKTIAKYKKQYGTALA